jgi:hypothetical protein
VERCIGTSSCYSRDTNAAGLGNVQGGWTGEPHAAATGMLHRFATLLERGWPCQFTKDMHCMPRTFASQTRRCWAGNPQFFCMIHTYIRVGDSEELPQLADAVRCRFAKHPPVCAISQGRQQHATYTSTWLTLNGPTTKPIFHHANYLSYGLLQACEEELSSR